MPQRFEALHAAGEIFNPDFLAVVQDARELRFMDWMKTNGSEQTSFSARPEVSDATWTGPGGVPLEVMVQLANQTGTDPWFCMPAKATDAYVESFAAYVRDHLDPALKAHVEFSNETWNWSFSQTGWLDGQAKAAWGPKAAVYDYVAMRATQVAMIWDETFGSQADARVENVLAVQNANPGVASRELAGKLWAQHDPAGFVAPGSVFDALAVTTYFGNAAMGQDGLRAQLLAKIKDPHVDAVAWLAGKLMDPAYASSIPADRGQVGGQQGGGGQVRARPRGLRGRPARAPELRAERDQRGRPRDPDRLHDGLRALPADGRALRRAVGRLGGGLGRAVHAVRRPRPSPPNGARGGCSRALATPTRARPRSWPRTRATMPGSATAAARATSRGRILQAGNGGETLVGTQKIDFLVGGKGDDTFVAGRGDDGINGGAGYDTLVLAGSPDAYAIRAEGDGYRITGPDGSDYVINVEAFRFDGARTMTLAQMLGRPA